MDTILSKKFALSYMYQNCEGAYHPSEYVDNKMIENHNIKGNIKDCDYFDELINCNEFVKGICLRYNKLDIPSVKKFIAFALANNHKYSNRFTLLIADGDKYVSDIDMDVYDAINKAGIEIKHVEFDENLYYDTGVAIGWTYIPHMTIGILIASLIILLIMHVKK